MHAYCELVNDFNPRAPGGARLILLLVCYSGIRFQSTHPLRGATIFEPHTKKGERISIHAPLAGCDDVKQETGIAVDVFQSTHPLRGATFLELNSDNKPFNFNPRTPCGVRRAAFFGRNSSEYFNPRTPCGVRPRAGISADQAWNFNPRTPCGVRRLSSSFNCTGLRFQSTHPLR